MAHRKAPASTRAKMGGMTYRVFTATRPQAVILGTKLRWWVLSMPREKSISRPGIRVKTVSRLRRMALISTTPMS